MTRQPDSPEPLDDLIERWHVWNATSDDDLKVMLGLRLMQDAFDEVRQRAARSAIPAAEVSGYDRCELTHKPGTTHFHPIRVSDRIKAWQEQQDSTTARSAIPAAEGLDMERLARAMESFYGKRRGAFNVTAPAIADRYARLATDPPEPRDG